jgi:bifunctional NMN adenylyltransferase/nudix hydrolase
MNKEEYRSRNVGVIVGRFQVPRLTSGHLKLIDHVLEKSDKILIFVGKCHVRLDLRDPLPPDIVVSMITSTLEDRYSDVRDLFTVETISDESSNDYWSNKLDLQIEQLVQEADDVTLYGGRDSFLKSYTGSFCVENFESKDPSEGTKTRNEIQQAKIEHIKDIAGSLNVHEAFRAGIIYAASLPFPTSYQCVDIIGFTDTSKIVLIRKKGSSVWQLPGGFVDVSDDNLLDAAKREFKEETNLIADNMNVITSKRIDDFRYRNRRDKIMTVLFETRLCDKELLYMKALDDAFDICAEKIRGVLSGDIPILKDHKQMVEFWASNTKKH